MLKGSLSVLLCSYYCWEGGAMCLSQLALATLDYNASFRARQGYVTGLGKYATNTEQVRVVRQLGRNKNTNRQWQGQQYFFFFVWLFMDNNLFSLIAV